MTPPIDQRSFLHRQLEIEPGHAPAYLYARDQCLGLDALVAAGALGLFCGLLMLAAAPPLGVALIVLTIGFELFIAEPFSRCERKARARLRQAGSQMETRKP